MSTAAEIKKLFTTTEVPAGIYMCEYAAANGIKCIFDN